MKVAQGVRLIVLIGGFMLLPYIQTTVYAGEDLGAGNCGQVVDLLKKQNKKLSREFGQLKREIAVLHQALDEPGFKDIVGGIGYIVGLFGVAAYVAARKEGKG